MLKQTTSTKARIRHSLKETRENKTPKVEKVLSRK